MVLGKIKSVGLAPFAIILSRSFSISAVGMGNLRPFVLPPLALQVESTVGLGTHPNHVNIIEQIAVFRIRHFLLTAACVQEVAHPQLFFIICRMEQSLEFVGFVRLDLFFLVIQLPQDFPSEKNGVGTQECVASLEDVVDITGFKQSVPGGLALSQEGYVTQQVVALCELIEVLDPAALAPVQKIAQPPGVRLHGLGVFEQGFLGKELLNVVHYSFAIGIAILLDRYATAHGVKSSLPALHGFNRCLEIHSNGFVFRPVPQVERTRNIFLRAPTPPFQVDRNVAPILTLAQHPVQLH
jgi:hypothetical protein